MMRAMRIPVPADGGSKPMRSEYGRNATAFTAIAGLGLVVACPAVAQEADGRELLIENVTILSAERERPQEHRHVLIRDGRIVEVRAESIQANANVHRLDGSGKYLTPGLMDSHVHVSDVPGLPPQAVFSSAGKDAQLASLRDAYIRQQPRSYLYFGVTQLLDPSSFPPGIEAFKTQPAHPDLFWCGAAPVLDGYPSVFVDKRVRYSLMPNYIVDSASQRNDSLPDGETPALHTPEAVVERVALSGARCIKVFIEDGFGDRSDWPLMSDETLGRVRAAARTHKLLVLAHANALDMQRIGAGGGVDVFAHGLWNWNELDGAPGVPAAIGAHLREVHAKQIGFQPTLRVMAGLAALFRPETLNDPQYARVVPPALLAWYATEAGRWYKREMRRDYGAMSDEQIDRTLMRVAEQGARAMRYLFELGHPLLLGSDTPSSPTYGNQPGYDTFREMQAMAQAGIPLPAIFEAATINNARQFGLEGSYGTIEAGKVANLLLLDRNPLVNVDAWNSIDTIILHGRVLTRESLAAGIDTDSRYSQ